MYQEALQHMSLDQQNQFSSDFQLCENANSFENINNLGNEISPVLNDNNNLNKGQNFDEYGKDILFNKNEENDINFD